MCIHAWRARTQSFMRTIQASTTQLNANKTKRIYIYIYIYIYTHTHIYTHIHGMLAHKASSVPHKHPQDSSTQTKQNAPISGSQHQGARYILAILQLLIYTYIHTQKFSDKKEHKHQQHKTKRTYIWQLAPRCLTGTGHASAACPLLHLLLV
jgi:hypothetical protein